MSDATITSYLSARTTACQSFLADNDIHALWHSLSTAMDGLIGALYATAKPKGMSIMAVGGYGRSELLPFSDVDVIILTDAPVRDADQIIQWLYPLWNLGLQLSHAVYTVEQAVEAARQDHTICASLMDLRLVVGERKLATALKRSLKDIVGSNMLQFVEAKLSERDARHAKYGDSRFMLEPHVKEGKGGLRDVHTLQWLVRYCYPVARPKDAVKLGLLSAKDWDMFEAATLFFSRVRAHLHLARGRADERLSFDMQIHIAQALGFVGETPQQKAEAFMFRYFDYTREVGALTRALCALLEEEKKRKPTLAIGAQLRHGEVIDGFALETGRLNFHPEQSLTHAPALAIRLFAVAQREGLDVHPQALIALHTSLPMLQQHLPNDAASSAAFLEILLSSKGPEVTLRKMNEAGVLGALIPEFTGIVGQMQYDGYHTYTVDEHTIVAVGNLFTIESGALKDELPLSTRVAKEIVERRALYIGMLCHDIAKGMGGGHNIKGEAMVVALAQRLGLRADEAELAAWLVRHHLLLSEMAFKRDLDDPQTIQALVNIIQSPERLRLLLLVTVADIRAVGPTIYNGWKGELLRRVYERCIRAMGVSLTSLSSQDTGTQHEAMIAAFNGTPHLEVTTDTFRDITLVTCCVAYQKNAFRVLAGVMALMGASIVSAKIHAIKAGVLLAEFGIQDMQSHAFTEAERLERLPELVVQALQGTLDFATELPRRSVVRTGRKISVTAAVYMDDNVSHDATILEVNAQDRLGLLYDILGALEEEQLQIVTAHIATYGQKAVDVFYIKDAYGLKLDHPAKKTQVVEHIMSVVA
ncbi:MAG: [protein-PII] uridylyltransferase [Alphaproteobacteria bacterium]|nr:[protein-PII] uridylyltransferase [Alphaproteobacteria bacterium]